LVCRSETSKIVSGITHFKFYGVMCLPGENGKKMQEKMTGGGAKNMPRNAWPAVGILKCFDLQGT
jgi:hypothetical protein